MANRVNRTARSHRGRTGGSAREGEWIPHYLIEALSLGDKLYPDDFNHLVSDWASDAGIEDVEPGTTASELTRDERTAFTKWLRSPKASAAIIQWVRDEPTALPPYAYFSEPSRVDSETWLLHFTSKSPFTQFNRGATYENLALTKHRPAAASTAVDCKKNLSEDATSFEAVVFGFAVAPQGRFPFREMARLYGRNGVLFRSSLAVRAFHNGDEDWQVIFPLCSERDVLAIWEINARGGGVVDVDGERVECDTFDEVVRVAQRASAAGLTRGRACARPATRTRLR